MNTDRFVAAFALFGLACAGGARSGYVAPASPSPVIATASEPAPVPAPMSDEALVAQCRERELILRAKERAQCSAAEERLRLKNASTAQPPVLPTATVSPPAVATAPTTAPPIATASPPGSDPAADEAAARVLYDDGLKLMDEKAYAKACPKLEESHRLKANVNVQFFLADCYEQIGRTASAWLHFSGAATRAKSAGQAAKAEQAKKRATALEPKLTRVTIKIAEEVPGLEVRRSGVLVTKPQWDSAIPVDPGDVEVVASAPNRKPFSTIVQAKAPGTFVIQVPPLIASPK